MKKNWLTLFVLVALIFGAVFCSNNYVKVYAQLDSYETNILATTSDEEIIIPEDGEEKSGAQFWDGKGMPDGYCRNPDYVLLHKRCI